ncbi:MAG: SLC13 family permease, partial [Candidatus Hadarchaeales archaeon]
MIPIPIIILGIVFALIATRRIGHIKIQMWQSMMVGAIAVLMTGQIHPIDALKSINLDVMLFLFGMFVVGSALEESGYLAHLAYRFFRKARSVDHLVLLLLFGFGAMSAFLMNDTVAIVGVPVVLLLARHHCIPPKLLLLTLAFAVTIGSTMSPIGNPQNLLVAVNGNISNPFVTFFQYLLLPTLINLLLAYLLLKLFYRKHFHKTPLAHSQEPIRDKKLAWLCRVSLVLLITLVVAKIAMAALGTQVDFRLVYIALISALPILILSSRRLEV